MTEKYQNTTAHRCEHMKSRYDDGLKHKHNTYHNPYRRHCKTHPVHPYTAIQELDGSEMNHRTGLVKEDRLRKTRMRMRRGGFH